MKKMLFLLLFAFILLSVVPCFAQGTKVVAIDASGGHSMALTIDGNVWVWGDNTYGQLGNSSITANQSLLPIQANITNAEAISTGSDTVSVLKSDGTVWSWGFTSTGQMGNGKQAGYGYKLVNAAMITNTPVVANISNVTEISVGTGFIEALKNDGTVWQWGSGYRMGLGTDTNVIIWSPIQVKRLSNIKNVKAGFNHAIALDSDGRVWTWGENITNSSDIHGYDLISTPAQVPISDVKAIAAGYGFSLALKNDGTVWGWGDDTFGMLGDGVYFGGFTSSWSDVNRLTPVMAQGLNDVIAIDSYDELSLALKKDGTVWEWGRENSNKILTTPTQVPIDNVMAIACGTGYFLALKSDGSVWSWGDNQNGGLGTGTTDSSSTPVRVLVDNIQSSSSTTTDHTVDQPVGQPANTSGTGNILSSIISPKLIMVVAALIIIAFIIAYYIKK